MSIPPPLPGTVVVYGPFFARTGFGVLARGTAMGLHQAGVKVRIVPVDCNDPNASGDLDDVDLYLLQSLRYTPVHGPVTAIFAYVPTYAWPKLALPEPCQRIMLTTFDSSANAATPPSRLIFICNQMDQVWVSNPAEVQAWIKGGIDPARIHSFNWAHEWIDNALLGPAVARERPAGTPFRFLHISLFLPRRRLDVLIRAFFEEFPRAEEAELYLKMSYPSWHPIPGKPKVDLLALIERLRRATGSQAAVVVDETLGTRRDLARLIDHSDAYVSPDTTHTAPVTEAIVRERPVIVTEGWGVELPPEIIAVPNGTDRVALTPEMADYMPHQKGASFPTLHVDDMRRALRRVADMGADERRAAVTAGRQFMRDRYSYAATAPVMVKLIREGWASRQRPTVEVTSKFASAVRPAQPLKVHWAGLQLFHGKIPRFNREIAHELIRRGHQVSLSPGNGPFHIEEFDLTGSEKFRELARHFHDPVSGQADLSVSFRWHPIVNEHAARRQILGHTWWSGAIPTEWVRPIAENVNEVWVPSGFVRDNFIAGGVDAARLQVIPMGVDPAVFNPAAAPFGLKTRKNFRFLFVGETSPRRGLDLLLAAYLRTFRPQDDVCLVIKDMDCEDYYARRASRKVIAECLANPRCPEIEYITDMLPDAELAGLYVSCHCLVQPHRMASVNLAAMEAMACGLPVITTDFGGVRDFATNENAYLMPAKIVRQRPATVGHWRVTGEQLHADVDVGVVSERLRHVFQHVAEARAKGARASAEIGDTFTWQRSADLVLQRMEAVLASEDGRSQSVRGAGAARGATADALAGDPTVVIYAPFYNRSGYGVAARCLAAAWGAAGVKLRIMPVDNVEEGVDDCDLAWLRSLEKTPITGRVIAVFFHVATPAWLTVALPADSIRILFTTFDGTAQGLKPPTEWVEVCNQMDQLWLQTDKEATVFASAGVARAKIHVLRCPHPWIQNAALPVAAPRPVGAKFRFTSIAMFMPRRRWDTLIEAFLAEFQETAGAELYLKVNYPSWHPVPGQPAKDLQHLIESLREKTGSAAAIIVDEDLGTRAGICRVIDSCDAYVSTDTTITAPVGEAFVRGKIAIIPDGYGAALPYCESALVIPVDPKLSRPMTEEMLQYQPHHRGRDLPLLRVEDVRRTLRAAFELPEAQRREMGRLASLHMECTYGPAVVTPAFLQAMNQAVGEKCSRMPSPLAVSWEGTFLDYGSLSGVNRALTAALGQRPSLAVSRIGDAALTTAAGGDRELRELAGRLSSKAPAETKITVRHQWPPDWSRPKQGALVIIQPWEFGVLPADWVRQAEQVQEFWVPSTYVRDVYVNSGVSANKVKVVPNGIDPETFQPAATPLALATRKSFKFLFVGGTIQRKGPDILLKAYLESFSVADDVCLVIKDFGGKSVYAGQTMEAQILAARSQPNAPEILYLNEELAPDALPGLYTACDCFVHPYRGEGFGLPILEAMACGLPVIITAGGSADDFASEGMAYRIPAVRKSIGDTISGIKLAGPGWLLEPDAVALAERMKWVAAHRDAARALGARAAVHARTQWTWERAAAVAEGNLQALAVRLGEGLRPAKPAVARQPAPITLPPVAQLGQLAKAQDLFRRKSPRAAWENTCEAIRIRPHHPEAFLLLAEIARLVGDAGSARSCAQHAQSLAPAFKPVKKFLQGNVHGQAKPGWLVLPPEIESRRKKARARLSVCLIVKNEEQFIGQCLASVKDLADQIVVVDTGSTDRTVAIAREYGAEIHEFTWCDDFSAARNAALMHATGEWVLSLDADEEVPLENHAALRHLLADEAVMGWRLPLFDVGREGEGHSFVPRLFRNAPGLFWIGRVHEQVFYSVEARRKEWGLDNRMGDAALRHHGYTKELVRERGKVERNLRLLEQAINEIPDDPSLLMNYGLELIRSDRLEEGLRQYRAAFAMMSERPAATVVPETREALLTQYGAHLLAAKRAAEVPPVLTSPLARGAGLTASQHFVLGMAYMELRQFSAAVQEMAQCLAKRELPALTPANPEIRKVTPRHCMALCHWHAKDSAGALREFQAAMAEAPTAGKVAIDFARFLHEQGQFVEALQLLHQFTSAQPAVASAWMAGGQIALSQPGLLEVAVDWTAVALTHHPEDPALLAQRAEALLLAGRLQEALPLWTKLGSETGPRVLGARVLCEVALGSAPSVPPPITAGAVSEEFVRWYWRLVDFGAEPVILQLHANVGGLEPVLPDAAQLLHSVMAKLDVAAVA